MLEKRILAGGESKWRAGRALRGSALFMLDLTFITTLDPPKTSAELPNGYWSLCKALSLDRKCYLRLIARNSTNRYSRLITRSSTHRYCSAEPLSPVLKVKSGLCLFFETLVASYLLLLAGDICENPVQKQDLLMAKRGTYYMQIPLS